MFFTKAWKFIKKNAFYVGLVLCVVVIGAVTVISSLPREKEEQPSEIVDNQTGETLTDVQKPQESPQQTAAVSEQQSDPTASKAPAKRVASVSTSVSLTKPLDGELITAFSGDTLVFNSTLNM